MKELGKAMNELERYRAPAVRFVVKRGKTVGQPEHRWVVWDTRFQEWMIAGENYRVIKNTADGWNVEEIKRPQLVLVVSNSYDWYQLTVRKLSRVLPRQNDRKNQVHLSLVR
jgi:hypothetical protein